tara:strand:- start:89 stop:484 length:396 start_codon:yes stop_codon:yes gene_type:complete
MDKINQKDLIGISALLVHAAKIDEHYSDKEKKIILNFINKVKENNSNSEQILKDAENLENNSNQLLNFTNEIKKKGNDFKSSIVEEVWRIILSDKDIDNYESNLVRRICGLIYFSDKESGEIKLKISRENL